MNSVDGTHDLLAEFYALPWAPASGYGQAGTDGSGGAGAGPSVSWLQELRGEGTSVISWADLGSNSGDAGSHSSKVTVLAELPEFPADLSTAVQAGSIGVAALDPELHTTGCSCVGCCMKVEPLEVVASSADGSTSTGGSSASAPAILGDMADFLRVGYWNTPHQFNLTDSGLAANSGVLHYNVTGFSNIGGAGTDTNGISSARADLVREAFKIFEEVLGIDFVETTSTDTNVVDFFFKDNDSGAYASSTYYTSSGNILYSWINVATGWSGGTSTYDDYTLQTIFHEIGHALGLGHQGPYNGSATYGVDNLFENDSWQASMMSYFSQTENTSINASYEFLQTPMSVDWMALDDIYGSQSYGGQSFGVDNAFLGDTVYGFNTNISSVVSDIWANFATYADQTASTIVDGGGIDTLDFSGYSATQLINLSLTDRGATAPSTSNIGGRIGNLTLAEGTVIENAVGGSGADTFIGNFADNTFTGNGGDDTFSDSAGNDTYLGGAGTDQVDFSDTFASYSFSLSGTFLEVINVTIDMVENTIEWLGFADQTLSFADIVNSIGPNSVPVAVDDAYSVDEDVVLSGQNVLGNDSDADPGDTLSVSAVNGSAANVGNQIALASGALLTVNADGSFGYDQNGAFDSLLAGETAQEIFTYTASDGQDTDTATVTITINGASDNQAPIADNDSYAVDEAATLAGAVLGNDSDPDGGTLSVTEVNGSGANVGGEITLASGALLTMNADGTFDYDPNGAFDGLETGQTGSDSFTYTISDGQGGSDSATVNITVNGYSDPVAETPVVIDFEGIATGAYAGEHGLAISGLTVSSGTNLSGAQRGQTDGAGDFTITATGEDFDLDALELRSAGGRVRVEVFAYDDGVLVGSAVFNPRSNKITNATFDGTFDSVDRVVFDGNGQYYVDDISLITRTPVDPGGNLAPVAADDAFTTAENAPITGQNLLADNGAGVDSDPDGDPLTLVSVAGDGDGSAALSSGALVTFAADGTFSYDPNGAFDGLYDGETATDTFIYEISDGNGGSDTGSVTVTINGVGTPPPPPTTHVIGFEAGVDEDGFDFTDTVTTTRATGVAAGAQAGQSVGDAMSFVRFDGDSFDFESAVFTAVSGKNVTATVTGYLGGVEVGSESFRIRDNKETTRSLDDSVFDNVDQVVISASGGVIVDELTLIV